MPERKYDFEIVAFVEEPSGEHQRYVIECLGPGNVCLDEEIWSGEGINSVAGRVLRTEAGINIPPNSKINAFVDGDCKECPLRKSSG